MSDSPKLSVENHIERDSRLNHWSVHGLGPTSHSTEDWVRMFLSAKFEIELSEMLQDMFDRAVACMVYGCYHYPLFTLGFEEMLRFQESAFREAVKTTGASKTVLSKMYAPLQSWALEQGFLDDAHAKQWNASRSLRNATSHKDSALLLGPNDALNQIGNTIQLVQALFHACSKYDQS